ncbi:hypothetical protein KYB31_06580 [Clostridium felsineum]|uniref:hypothetical protein n=1 Tax=Clostridium felsineum TaxID=36839 RepID=UPI00098BDB66|nr:hypothetical protein [Clostridium felsineum]MCR3758660.1 hypothetical protein [Clostridium felsineum]URZ18534.1 hypothetical protein CLFE_046220 [Clostridium felsineum DSM 794]
MISINKVTIKAISDTVQSLSDVFDAETVASVLQYMNYSGSLNLEQVTFILLNYTHMSYPQMCKYYPNYKGPIHYFINKAIKFNVLPRKGKNYNVNITVRNREITDFIISNKGLLSLSQMANRLGISKSCVRTRLKKIKNQY